MGIRSQSLINFFKLNIDKLSENSVSVIEAKSDSVLVRLDEFDTTILLSKEGQFFVGSALLTKIQNSRHLSIILTNLMKLHGLNLGVRTFLESDSQIGIIADDFSCDFNAEELCAWLYQFQFIANTALSIISISIGSEKVLSQSEIEGFFDKAS